MRAGEVGQAWPTGRHGRTASMKDENNIRRVKSSVTSFNTIHSTTDFIWLMRNVL